MELQPCIQAGFLHSCGILSVIDPLRDQAKLGQGVGDLFLLVEERKLAGVGRERLLRAGLCNAGLYTSKVIKTPWRIMVLDQGVHA